MVQSVGLILDVQELVNLFAGMLPISLVAIYPRGVHGSDWCGLNQIRHQSITYGLIDLEFVTNLQLLKSDPILSVEERIESD